MTYRYATHDDIDRYYSGAVPWTVRAIVVLEGDTAIGVIGLKRQLGCWEFFSEFRECYRDRLRRFTCLKAIKEAMRLVKDCKAPVIAFVADEHDGHRVLTKLGFQKVEGGYLWPCSS